MPDAALSCRPAEGLELRPTRGRTDQEGNFTLKGLAEGSHTLSASAAGFASSRRDGVLVSAEGTPEVELVLERGVEFAVRVFGSDGAPLSGASARLRRTDAPDASTADPGQEVQELFTGDATTDADGRLELGRFVPGVYELSVWRGFDRQTRPSVMLEEGQGRLELRVDL